ncbi:hypothetical protein F66182_3134 [Fusarium sp. NRRL 66182]|nr:hypothetical protein F66182_3134 [Fusarium sp. NRRL 66182]
MYYGVNATEHIERTDNLKLRYRPISLSMYGSPDDPRYIAMWQYPNTTGYQWVMKHHTDKKSYEAWVEEWRGRGYMSTHVSATGPADKAVFAGIMEFRPGKKWNQACHVKNISDFVKLEPAGNGNMYSNTPITGLSMYGTPEERRYCVLTERNLGNHHMTISTKTLERFRETLRPELLKRFWRVSRLYLSEDHMITTVFVDKSIGRWTYAVNLTKSELSKKIKAQEKKGLRPNDIQGGGTGSNERFSAVFTELLTPKPRKWTVTGYMRNEHVRDLQPDIDAMDEWMRLFMQKYGIRQAQLAAAVRGTISVARGYTWAEDDRAVVDPSDVFLLGGASKMFTHAAVLHLMERGKLEPSTRVYPALGYTNLTDPRAHDITVQHLLEMKGGDDLEVSGDPVFMFDKIAMSLPTKGERSATVRDVVDYMAAQKLDFEPGSRVAHSNYAALLLGYLVSNITNMDYYTFLHANLFKTVIQGGIDVRPFNNLATNHAGDRIVQESAFSGQNPLKPLSKSMIPMVYGGDGSVKNESIATMSLIASASSLAISAWHYAALGTTYEGSVEGAYTYVSRGSDFDWALVFNTRAFNSSDDKFRRFINSDIKKTLKLLRGAQFLDRLEKIGFSLK